MVGEGFFDSIVENVGDGFVGLKTDIDDIGHFIYKI